MTVECLFWCHSYETLILTGDCFDEHRSERIVSTTVPPAHRFRRDRLFLASEKVKDGLLGSARFARYMVNMLTKVSISPMSSPLVPDILVFLSHSASETSETSAHQLQRPAEPLTSAHRHRSGRSALIFDDHGLMVRYVVLGLVDALTVTRRLESLCHCLDVDDLGVDHNSCHPLADHISSHRPAHKSHGSHVAHPY